MAVQIVVVTVNGVFILFVQLYLYRLQSGCLAAGCWRYGDLKSVLFKHLLTYIKKAALSGLF